MAVKISSLTFPSFYAECAYRDGFRDSEDMTGARIVSYYRHGDPEPVGFDWYHRGLQAHRLGLAVNA